MSGLTHVGEDGAARMVNVGEKDRTDRRARARGFVRLRPDVIDLISSNSIPKGDVLAAARIAAVMAAKKTPDIIPLCHPVAVTGVEVEFIINRDAGEIIITTVVTAQDRTGVEMEALTAAAAAGLTIYDMCKAVQRDMSFGPFFLLEKEGGRSGHYKHPEA